MKFNLKIALASACTFCSFAPLSEALITVNFGAGDLRNNAGVLVPQGGLLELIADTGNNGFAAPTANTFVTGDDIVVAKFALSAVSGAGTTSNSLQYTPSNFTGLVQGDSLLFRWFPSLTTASTAPGVGTMYGQFNTSVSQDGSSLIPPWTEPADGGTYTLNFLTASEGGANANSLGYATSTVVPEPSTGMMLGGGIVTFAGAFLLRRRVKTKGLNS